MNHSFAPWLEQHDACGVGLIYQRDSSHEVIKAGLHALACVEHRGACGSDRETGDGAGLLTAIPWKLLASEGFPTEGSIAVGMVYLPKGAVEECRSALEELLKSEGLSIKGWRRVPIKTQALGSLAMFTCPQIEQVFVAPNRALPEHEFEQKLMVARKRAVNLLWQRKEFEDFYIASLSSRTVVYKALVKANMLDKFYADLSNPLFESRWVTFHRRFSTNTFPRWALAQPFRLLAHNGEINTLTSNRNWMKAREPLLDHPAWDKCKQERHSVIYSGGSDSGSLDNALELLVWLGHSPEAALMQLIPEAYRQQPELETRQEICDFYEYHAALQEPWDGPAFIVYSDGRSVGAVLDRNGLRPARYTLLKNGTIIVASESGLLGYAPDMVQEHGRLGPGQMLSVDIESGEISGNWAIKEKVAKQYPYAEWLQRQRIAVPPQAFLEEPTFELKQLVEQQLAFGYGKEEVENVIVQMAEGGAEPIFSMGDDTPLAILSSQPKVVYEYFKQRFAQVTNPPIDPLRESLVMALDVYLGKRDSFAAPGEHSERILHLDSPLISEKQLSHIKELDSSLGVVELSLLCPEKDVDFESVIDSLCIEARAAVKAGKQIIVLSDRGVNYKQIAVPALLAVGALHHELTNAGVRLDCSIVVETGQCWDVHHVACLLAYGAQAVCPYLALESIRQWHFRRAAADQLSVQDAQRNYLKAAEKGLRKVLSKMGICTVTSYIGAQTFEALGLGPNVIKRCFAGTTSRLGGLEFDGLAQESLQFHVYAFPEARELINYGKMRFRPSGEFHANNPQLVKALHAALGVNNRPSHHEERERHAAYQSYSKLVRERPAVTLRDLLSFRSDRSPISASEVESVDEIVKYFCTGGMSLGALSKESHEALAIAMNRLGARSNCGEGGEDPLRYYPIQDIGRDGTSPHFPGLTNLKQGDNAASAIRQVASARFGVTPAYLVTSDQLEIKIAQGAKPGEGGQLPGHKVSDYIAQLRRAKPGTPLISPPPHHDIYSIEDLSQLIYDLKQANSQAKISVKLVAQIGVGTVAAGVAKANADIIHIAGHDGGTGASPLSSMKHSGIPWELGLAEAHQVLMANGLRDRVTLRVDGGLRAGWDVIIAALLGADEFCFGTIALMAQGCVMARICHTNNCPVGITTQKEELRARFHGSPDSVVDFFIAVAHEVRHQLAELGFKTLKELVGRVDLLDVRTDVQPSKIDALNLSCLVQLPVPDDRRWLGAAEETHQNEESFDDSLLDDPDVSWAIHTQNQVHKEYWLRNTDRSVGTRISGVIAKRYGDHGFKGKICLDFTGVAGQSFGAFNVQNVNLSLTGQANDYVGKGMNGGQIVVKPEPHWQLDAANCVLVGNTCLYGATGGKLFVAGQAGERFAVRNSAAVAVVEGAGDHCCEYMTGGTVVVLGNIGRNFGAGMTGGTAFILDANNDCMDKLNLDEGKEVTPLTADDRALLKSLIEEFHAATDSRTANTILSDWDRHQSLFKQIKAG